MLKTYLKKHSKLLIYLIGLILISTLLYFVILRHNGYIYYWDLSGAFDFRDPFGQYFRMYTPWDGISLGVKNRLPIISLIYLIYLPFEALGASNYAVIKIAITLLFIGGYTTFYLLFPKLLEIFSKEKYKEKYINIWSLILGLIYSFIPFYTYRVSQLHLFYMSIFYLIQVYFFIKILNSKKVEKRTILFFILAMFFGLTSPNVIFFDLVTFGLIFIIFLVEKKFDWKNIKTAIYSLLLALLGVIITNLYWVIPYLLMGSPTPGYVINETMVDMLSQGTTLFNFIVGQADWFVGQGDLGVLDHLTPSIVIVQIIGVLVLYSVGIYGLLKYVKKSYAIFISILLLLSAYLVLDFMPYHEQVFSALVYSPVGWVFREVNRISFFWYLWIYILFAIGSYRLYLDVIKSKSLSKIVKWIYIPAIFIPFIVYILPVNVKILKYLKPIEIDYTIEEVFDYLKSDTDYFSVLYYPVVDYYSIPWMQDKFEIADSEEYKWLVYNSPKPPIYLSSVIPNAKTYQALLTEYLFEERDVLLEVGDELQNAGVKYVVVRKAAEPINLTKDYVRADIIYPAYLDLVESSDFNLVLENEYYAVFENLKFRDIANNKENTVYSMSSFSILEHLPQEVSEEFNVRFCTFDTTWNSCFDNVSDGKVFIEYDDHENQFINLLSKEEKLKYGIYPYDYTYEHGINTGWGRASFYDSVNGELHNVFRKYDIHAWNFDVVDKVAYSDRAFVQYEDSDDDYTSSMNFDVESTCSGDCNVFVNVLYSHLGGDLKIKINDKSFDINTKSDFEDFKWVELDINNLSSELKIELFSKNSINAIGGILFLPIDLVAEKKDIYEGLNIVEVPHEGVLNEEDWILTPSSCNFETVGSGDERITVKPNLSCLSWDSLYLSNHNFNFLIRNNNYSALSYDAYKNKIVEDGVYELILIGKEDIFVVIVLSAEFIIIAILLLIILI